MGECVRVRLRVRVRGQHLHAVHPASELLRDVPEWVRNPARRAIYRLQRLRRATRCYAARGVGVRAARGDAESALGRRG